MGGFYTADEVDTLLSGAISQGIATAKGDTLVANSAGTWIVKAAGTSGQIFKVSDGSGNLGWAAGLTHASTHLAGQTDAVNVSGLTGLLATSQVPRAHASGHQAAMGDVINVSGLTGLLLTAQTPTAHGSGTHQVGGTDALNVSGLVGLLTTAQIPTAHGSGTHQAGGTDVVNVSGLTGLLATSQTPIANVSNTYVVYISGVALTGQSGFSYDVVSGALTATYFIGNGSLLTSISGATLPTTSGFAAATYATSGTVAALQAVSGAVNVGNLSGDVYSLKAISGNSILKATATAKGQMLVANSADTWIAMNAGTSGQTIKMSDGSGNIAWGAGVAATHATTHQDGQADEINVSGLAGLLVTAQVALAHATAHTSGGTDLMSGISPLAHAVTHLSGGVDYMSGFDAAALAAAVGTSIADAEPKAPSGDTAFHAHAAILAAVATPIYTWVIATPAVGGILGPRLHQGLTCHRLDAHCKDATSVTFNIEERSTIGSAGTNILAADMVADVDGETTGTFDNAGLAADCWLYIDISEVSGNPGQITISLACTVT
jgi:hypothetical protein